MNKELQNIEEKPNILLTEIWSKELQNIKEKLLIIILAWIITSSNSFHEVPWLCLFIPVLLGQPTGMKFVGPVVQPWQNTGFLEALSP